MAKTPQYGTHLESWIVMSFIIGQLWE